MDAEDGEARNWDYANRRRNATVLTAQKQGLDDNVFHSRAIRSKSRRIEDDPEPMVQQQLARLPILRKSGGSTVS
jgi:hypothetical protein